MSTQNNFKSSDWAIIGDINYEFNRSQDFTKFSDKKIKQISFHSSVINQLWQYIHSEVKIDSNSSVCLFLHSPYLQQDNRIVRHNGLGKFLDKHYSVPYFIDINTYSKLIDSQVLFYGLIQLTPEAFGAAYKILSSQENGVIFTTTQSDEKDIAKKLSEFIVAHTKSNTLRFGVAEGLNFLLEQGSLVLYPYGWPETDDYHLDIFKS